MIHMSRQGVVFTGSQADLDRLRQSFERDHFVLLADFLDSALVSVVLPHVQRAEYQSAAYKGIGSELRMAKNPALDVLFFLANDLRLFGLVQAITGCGHIGSFEGRIYKLISHPQHNSPAPVLLDPAGSVTLLHNVIEDFIFHCLAPMGPRKKSNEPNGAKARRERSAECCHGLQLKSA